MWTTLLVAFVAVGAIVGVILLLMWPRRNRSLKDFERLNVRDFYPAIHLPQTRIEFYHELKDKLRAEYSKAVDGSDLWMSNLPPREKDVLKYRLMQRAIGDMALLQRVDSDSRGYWKLFSRGIITRQFWQSVVEAEQTLTRELEAVKQEASSLEPRQDPQGIISEAMHFVIRYGAKLPDPQDVQQSADALEEMLKAYGPLGGMPGAPGGGSQANAAAMLAAAAAGMGMPGLIPPGAGPPGATGKDGAAMAAAAAAHAAAAAKAGLPGMPPGGMPPGMHPGMMPPGFPGLRPPLPPPGPAPSGSGESYTWKQDAEEVEVSVEVPASATKAEVKVSIQAQSIKVTHKQAVVVDGALAGRCDAAGSTWTLSKGRVVLSLEKNGARPWQSLFVAK